MRAKSLVVIGLFAGMSVAYGCHTIAGVRTDGVLATEDAGPGAGGAAGTGGMAGMGGMAGTGGVGGAGGGGGNGNCNPADCLANMCVQGACAPVNAVCTPSGSQFFVYVPTDFVQADSKMLVGYSSKSAYVAISDEGGANPVFRVRHIDGDGKLSNIVDCPVSTPNANMVSVRTTETEFVLQGHLGGPNATMAEISFPTNDPDGKISGPCVENPIPSWTQCTNRIETEVFVRNGNVTKYAVTCDDPADSTKWHIVMGGTDEPTYSDIAVGPNGDLSFRTAQIGFIAGERVIFTGPELAGDFFFRRESNAFMPEQIDFSGDPARQEGILSVIPITEGQSAYIIGASALLPPKFDASLVGGIVTDLSQLKTVPATGFKEFAHFSGGDVSKIGTYGQLAQDDISYYVAIIPLSKKGVDLYWFTKKGEPLINGMVAYQVPAMDSSTITRVAFVPLLVQRLVLWREENAGQVTVKGQRYVCAAGG